MALAFDHTSSDNPIAAIEEVHEAFRKNMRNHCSAQVIKLKWVKNHSVQEGYAIYLEHIRTNGIVSNWKKLLSKIEQEIQVEFDHVGDDWMLSSLSCFVLESEIWNAFEYEWRSIGDRPHWFIPQNRIEEMGKKSPTEQ